MTLLAPRTLLAAMAATLACTVAALPAAASGGPGGTITFQGALVEPTCLTEVQEQMPRPRVVSVHLLECRLTPMAALASPAAPAPLPASTLRSVSGPVEPMTLAAPVAELAGRAVVETLTLSYQ